MKRKILAAIAGVVLALVVIIAIEALGHAIYPPPPDIDLTDMDAMKTFIAGMPAGALWLVMLAWLVATSGGGLFACFIARETPFAYASIIGGLVLAGTIFNLTSIPHPLWFSITSVVAIIATTIITGWLASAFVSGPIGEPPAAE